MFVGQKPDDSKSLLHGVFSWLCLLERVIVPGTKTQEGQTDRDTGRTKTQVGQTDEDTGRTDRQTGIPQLVTNRLQTFPFL